MSYYALIWFGDDCRLIWSCAYCRVICKKKESAGIEMNSLAPYRLYMTTTTLINYILVNTFIPFPLISR